MTNNPLSVCCHAPLIVESSDEGTSFYRCTKCKEAADMAMESSSIFTVKEAKRVYEIMLAKSKEADELRLELSRTKEKLEKAKSWMNHRMFCSIHRVFMGVRLSDCNCGLGLALDEIEKEG